MEVYPSVRARLSTGATLIDHLLFGTSIVKVQRVKEHSLTTVERKSIQHLLKFRNANSVTGTPDSAISFADRLFKHLKS